MTESAPITHVSADRTHIQPGECVTFRWRVEGVKAVYFHPEGEWWQKVIPATRFADQAPAL